MPFGGLLSFEHSTFTLYKKQPLRHRLITKKFRKPLEVTAVCPIDEYDPLTCKTKEGSTLYRLLLGTKCGELYIIMFNLVHLRLMVIGVTDTYNSAKFMRIEYLGSKLSRCSAIAYLNDGYVYYGSKHGDSFLIKLEIENTLDPDRPQYSIVRVFNNLGEIRDLSMKVSSEEGVQNELIVAGGKGLNSHISLLKKGVSISVTTSIPDLPPLSGIFTPPNGKLYLTFIGVDQLLTFDLVIEKDSMQLVESDAQTLSGEVLLVDSCEAGTILVTQESVKLIDGAEFRGTFTAAASRNGVVAVATSDRSLILFKAPELSSPTAQTKLEHQVSALEVTDGYIYYALWDAPCYSFGILDATTLTTLVKHSTASFTERAAFNEFSRNLLLNKVDQAARLSFINSALPVTTITDIAAVRSDDGQDQVVCALADGRVLQFQVDTKILGHIERKELPL